MLLWGINGGEEDSVSRLGPVLWYDANTIGASNSSSVETWKDRSGNNYDATQSDSAKRPTFVRSDSLSNNRPSVYFDGTDDYLNISSSANDISRNIAGSTVFIVKNITTTATTGLSFAIDGGVTTGLSRMTFRKVNNAATITARRLDADAQGNRTGTSTLSTARPTIIHGRFDYAVTRNIILYVNNVVDGSATQFASSGNTSNTAPVNGMILGAGVGSPVGAFMTGYISEFLFFNKLLSIADSTNVYNYLRKKHGL